ncbi:class I SAM-dependent methyltransferase [Castellaniella sp. GW247-6E4]|uniref:class I SAM-dependent methyltransferase n=1 Tax=Castellaniella sp. GW247-6E4 TaxID=3140380 RepID=UPI00331493DD
MDQNGISDRNSEFWDELCGTGLAKFLGINDSSVESLKKFDDWYFDFYPYLFDHIPFNTMAGKDVLEVGLGYGTVSQKLAQSEANYKGLDIAVGPVSMVNHRLRQTGLLGEAIAGSILEPPFPAKSFDYIVAIGCLHHTGDLRAAIQRCWELLRPGGHLIFMVYYAYSYRRYRMALPVTLKNLYKEAMGYRGVVGGMSNDTERAAYDASSDGVGAPHTDWISVKSLKEYCGKFDNFRAKIENVDERFPFRWSVRKSVLETRLPSYIGLDLYATATK